ncbi:MAG TPA: helix-turn-helix domain-containing protein [Myxococcota bacterium]|nr:helix-turn-helix domain-containing protein [Myxococcota bacterium]HNH47273.1 helix-turn-helix domain-containing protein [Myxococcota bacterium]
MSKRLLVSQTFLSAVVRGDSLPSLRVVLGLREVYGVSFDWYLLGNGEMLASGAPLPQVAVPSPPAPPPHELHKLVEEVLELDDKEITAEVRGLIRGILHGRRKELERQREQEQLKKSA